MFGFFRFMLAMAVVFYHLYPPIGGGFAGPLAVLGFYVLAGFLIARVLDRQYDWTLSGTARFFLNRALRLLPAFWVVLAVSVFAIHANPQLATKLTPHFALPPAGDYVAWARNFFIFGGGLKTQIIPQGWSLTVEVIYYILMGVAAARGKILAFVWFCFSMILAIKYIADDNWQYLYFSRYGVSISFASGALLYYTRDVFRGIGKREAFVLVGLALIWPYMPAMQKAGIVNIPMFFHENYRTFQITSTIVLMTAAVGVLYTLEPFLKNLSARWNRVDDMLGLMAYPVFLTHYAAALLVTHFLYNRPTADLRDGQWFLVVLVVTLVFSYLIVRYIEIPMERWRAAVRPRKPTAYQWQTEALPARH